MSELKPGQDGEPLPNGERVLRLARESSDPGAAPNGAHPAAFELSTKEKKDANPRLSVWAVRLTQPQQAWELMDRKPQYRLVYYLAVDDIRSVVPELGIPELPLLEVLWHPKLLAAPSGEMVRDARPGADGHAGITGLNRPEQIPKSHYKLLRFRLAGKALVRSLASSLEEQIDAPVPSGPDVGADNVPSRIASPPIESSSRAAPGDSARETVSEGGASARRGGLAWLLGVGALCGLGLAMWLLAKVLGRGDHLDDARG